MNMEQKLEAILFYKNEPMEIKALAKVLGVEEREVREKLKRLQDSLEQQGRGVCLILTDQEVSLATAPAMSALIEQIAKDEMSRDIGKAGLETLAMILYNSQGVSRKKIDYIRGVNSTFILRNLHRRGLVERAQDIEDQRTLVYRPTPLLLAHIGVKDLSELPDFDKLQSELEKIQENLAEQQ